MITTVIFGACTIVCVFCAIRTNIMRKRIDKRIDNLISICDALNNSIKDVLGDADLEQKLRDIAEQQVEKYMKR